VCPTSRTIRNFKGSHIVATDFDAEGGKALGPMLSFVVWDVGATRFWAPRFGDVKCFSELWCFGEPLKTCAALAASLIPIGRSANEAIAARMVWRQGRTPKNDPMNFRPNKSNPTFPRTDLSFAS
jgi:hypothetical protein